jgi:hypothetical protein
MKRRVQFTLRSLLVLVLTLSLALGWGHRRVRRAVQDRKTAKALHASLSCAPQYGPSSENIFQWLLRKSLGDDVAGTARVIHVDGRSLSENEWDRIATFRDLDQLWLSEFKLKSADDIERLAHLHLRLLGVKTVELNPEVRSWIYRLSDLEVLWLEHGHGLLPAEVHRLETLLPRTEVTYLVVLE